MGTGILLYPYGISQMEDLPLFSHFLNHLAQTQQVTLPPSPAQVSDEGQAISGPYLNLMEPYIVDLALGDHPL